MSEEKFLAQSLNSKQLLALLYVLEGKRRGTYVGLDEFKRQQPSQWEETLSTFATRFAASTEEMRFEVLEAHLMSAEDIDLYHDETLKQLLDENHEYLEFLTQVLARDPRFQLEG